MTWHALTHDARREATRGLQAARLGSDTRGNASYLLAFLPSRAARSRP